MKCIKAVFLLILFLSAFVTSGQIPYVEWQKNFGGTLIDHAWSVQQTMDGGFIVAGDVTSINGDIAGNHGGMDCWVLKLDVTGSLQWKKCFGGTGTDGSISIKQTIDGGYIVAAYSNSINGDVTGNHGGGDFWIVKLDIGGSIQWQKCLGGTHHEDIWSIVQTTDGGYIVAGWSYSNDGDVYGNHGFQDYLIFKLNSTGSIQWQKCLGGSADDEATFIQQTIDGGYIVVGYSDSNDGDVSGNHGSYDYWVVKLDTIGAIQWQKCYGGTGAEFPHSITQTADGGYIIAGESYSNDGDVTGHHNDVDYADYWVVKLDTLGVIQWQKSLGGTKGDVANSIQQTSDGGYIVAGYVSSNDGDVFLINGNFDYWLVKLDTLGTITWKKCLGGSDDDFLNFIQQTTDGGYIAVGSSKSNNGDLSGNHGDLDCWIVKLAPLLGVESDENKEAISIYPNPNNGFFTIEAAFITNNKVNITLFDLLGKKVMDIEENSASTFFQKQINLVEIPSGIYFLCVQSDNKKTFQRVVKQ
jgi:hypothetical protein